MSFKHSFQIASPEQSRRVNFKFQIHRRRVFSFFTSLLAIVLITAVVFKFTAPSVQAAWFDDSWAYRQTVSFSHTETITSERRVTVTIDTTGLVTNSKIQSTCNDARFTDANGKLLRYQLTSACNLASTTFDVVFPTINNGQNLGYFYYGNPTAPSGSTDVSGVTSLGSINGGPVKIDEASNFGTMPGASRQIVRTSSGTLYGFVNNAGSCEVWKSTNGTSWTQQDSVNNPACDSGSILNLSITSTDVLQILYYTGDTIKYNTLTSDAFGTAETVYTKGATSSFTDLSLVTDSNNIPHVILIDFNSTSSASTVRYTNRVSGSWKAAVTVQTSTVISFDNTSLTMNEDNIVELTYINDTPSLIAVVGNVNDATSFTTQTVDSTILANTSIAVDSSGNTWVAYVDENGATDFVTLVKHNDADAWTTWQTPITNSNAGDEPSIAIVGTDIYIFYDDELADVKYDKYTGSWLGETNLQTGTFQDVKAKWAFLNDNQQSTQIDYLYSDATDVYWASLAVTAGPTVTVSGEEQGPSPISYWAFDEAQGSSTNDSTPQNNDLTITNAAWKTSDVCAVGNCLFFDGTGDYAAKSYSSDTELNPGTASFSVSLWFKHSSTVPGSNQFALARYITTGTPGGYKIYMNTSGQMCFGIDDDATWGPDDSACGATSYADSQWHYLSAVKSGTSTITLYIDGQRAKQTTVTATGSLSGTSTVMNIGIDTGQASGGWVGFLDEVKYYNFAKTAGNIQTEFASRSAPKGVSASFGGRSLGEGLSSGLVGYWKMDEASGNAADSSGNATTLTNNSSTPFTAAKFGNGAEFDGSTDFFDAADNAALSITGSMTLAAWIEPDDITGSETIIAKWGATESYLLTKEAANLRLYLNSTSNYEATTGSPLTANTKTHVAAVYNATSATVRLYVNGALQASSTTGTIPSSITDNTNEFSLAAEDTDGTAANFFDGHIDDVRVYNRALSSAEVRALYDWAPPPMAWWKMDENANTSANDSSSNSLTGTLTNSPAWATGKFGTGVKTDGTQQYISVATNSLLNQSGDFSISGWINPTGGLTNNLLRAENLPLVHKLDVNDGYDLGITEELLPYFSLENQTKTFTRYDNTSSADCNHTEANDNGCVLNLGSGGSWDDVNVELPIVIKDGSTYKMWYAGYDGTTSNRTGYATSSDGSVWTKYAGNTCSGTTGDGCIFDIGAASSWDDAHTIPGSVIKDGSTYKMWYAGHDGSAYRIGYATSSDGIAWTRYDDGGSAACGFSEANDDGCVLGLGAATEWNDAGMQYTSVIKDGSTYKMWFAGHDGSLPRIGYATSSDGISWTMNAGNNCSGTTGDGCIFDKGAASSWDVSNVYSPWVLKEGTIYKMFYVGSNGTNRTGLASSTDGITWTRFDNTSSAACGFSEANDNGCVFDKGAANSWDDAHTVSVSVLKVGNKYLHWYGAQDGANYRIGNSTFDTGISGSTAVSSSAFHHLAAVKSGTTLTLYVDGVAVSTGSTSVTTLSNSSSLLMGNLLNGTSDDVRVYNYARTGKQVVEDMNAGHPSSGSPISSQTLYYKFDEQNGSTINNSGFGSPTTATSTGTAWLLENNCKINGCLNFDTTTDNVAATDPSFFDGIATMSATFWINPQTLTGSRSIMSKSNTSQETFRIETWSTSSELKVTISNSLTDTSNYYATQGLGLTASAWQHIAVIYDAGDLSNPVKVYKNGVKSGGGVAGTIPYGLQASTADFRIGQSAGATSSLLAYIDEPKIYAGTALTSSEVAIDMNNGSAAALGGVLGTHNNEGFAGNPPVGWWKLDDNTGGSAIDSSGNTNTGTLTNGPVWRTGKIGPGLFFDGVNDLVTVSQSSSLNNVSALTVTAWMYTFSQSAGFNGRIVMKANSSNNLGWTLMQVGTTDQLRFTVDFEGGPNTNLTIDSDSVGEMTGTWKHIAVTWDGSSSATGVRFYSDGMEWPTNDPTDGNATRADDSAQSLTIANRSDAIVGSNAIFDDVRVYNYVLTPAQIAYVYARGGPVAHFKFDECQGATAYNSAATQSAQLLNGTINARSLGNTSVGDCTTSGSTMWFNGATGKYNSSLDFDSSDDDVSIVNNYTISLNQGLRNGFTASTWVYPNTSGESSAGQIFSKGSATYCQTTGSTPFNLACSLDLGTDATLTVNSVLPTNTWNNIVMSWTDDSDDEISLWVNGRSIGQSANGVGPTSVENNSLIIGNNSGQTATFDGQIDDFKIFSYEMTASQIQRLYNEDSAVRFGPQTGSP